VGPYPPPPGRALIRPAPSLALRRNPPPPVTGPRVSPFRVRGRKGRASPLALPAASTPRSTSLR